MGSPAASSTLTFPSEIRMNQVVCGHTRGFEGCVLTEENTARGITADDCLLLISLLGSGDGRSLAVQEVGERSCTAGYTNSKVPTLRPPSLHTYRWYEGPTPPEHSRRPRAPGASSHRAHREGRHLHTSAGRMNGRGELRKLKRSDSERDEQGRKEASSNTHLRKEYGKRERRRGLC